ncbi:acetoacetate--CoA ligase [Parahalioglobus pacificus]|uniref:Acetoacetyl-CoA synthetase n=1 Tax=Parahalioglobus pacificus TaxID=930806 RepID=A0A919CLW1_9GAMM|nr:acetoacetate--CoA ligase [Halioglobus pacificus]GHD37040.1 acetoacetyl-CoA synthetase [Halioglobus pacificus]
MGKPLWVPSDERVAGANITRFRAALSERGISVGESYSDLHQWSVEQPGLFWSAVWDYADVIADGDPAPAAENLDLFPGTQWFPNTRLNFAENLLRFRDERTAIVSLLENGERTETSYAQLYQQVAQLAGALRAQGVGIGDRVAAFLPNVSEAVVGMLATASIGAVWSSCSPDFGINGVQDRFGQIEPKVLITTDGYHYNGKRCDILERVAAIRESISSLEAVVIAPLLNAAPAISAIPGAVLYGDFIAANSTDLHFERLPFDHPLYILYSSGTTGVPKCIVHGAGGTLLQHLKEHQLQTDIGPLDTFFYFTTCGWMMWNWLVSGLASGATLVLYDGSPFASNGQVLLDAIDREGITVFGTSAKYIAELEKAGHKPRESHSLESLRTILSTGSPLSPESFEYVYRNLKGDVCLSSISGGTDIISCFVGGCPVLPVYSGEIQAAGLGMAVEIRDEEGQPIQGSKGELVCTVPFPSTPIGFLNDTDGSRYRDAYFDKYPNVWAHGDYGELTEHNGFIIHGRSDTVLNPGGVRIGTAEIYRQVARTPEVVDSVVIGQNWYDDVRVVLFVVLHDGAVLTDELQAKIRRTIRENATPRHVPAVIVQVSDIPRTISGKIAELAVRNVVHGEPVKNNDALANPECLELFRGLPALDS